MRRVNEEVFPNCPIRQILSRIMDKWSLLVLYTLNNADAALRFNALQRRIPDISQKMLSATLKTLVDDGFVVRKVYPEVPPRVEYTLTERAQTLLPHITTLIDWAIENFSGIVADRKRSIG